MAIMVLIRQRAHDKMMIKELSKNIILKPFHSKSRFERCSTQRCSTQKRHQSGLALITVMLIVTLATLIASSIVKRQSVDIRRTSTILGMAQAHQYLLSIESAAFFRLKLDFDNNGQVDHLNEQEWVGLLADALPGGEAEGTFSFELLDLQGLFNLNWLSNENPQSNKYRLRFVGLLNSLSIENSDQLAENVQKWLNKNSEDR